MQVVYNFIYADKNGKPQGFQMPVNVTEETDADLMHDICMSYLKVGNLEGTPLNAVSTQSKYPNYCFTTTECCNECASCRDKKMKGIKPYEPQSLEGKKIYIYEGKFGKVGDFGRKMIQKSYILPAPALLSDKLIQDFKEAMNKEPDGMGWELLGITFVHEMDPQAMTDKELENFGVKGFEISKAEPDRMIWAKIHNDQKAETAWIPALVRNGKILSAMDELTEPESSEDTREFDDCPIPGYRVVKVADPTSDLCMARIAVSVTRFKDKKTFMYINEFPIEKGLNDKEALRYLMRMVQNNFFGEYEMEPIYWEYLSWLNGKELHTPNILVKEVPEDETTVSHFLVSYIIPGNEKCPDTREYSCVVVPDFVIPTFGVMMNFPLLIQKQLQKAIGKEVEITQINHFNDVISGIPVVL